LKDANRIKTKEDQGGLSGLPDGSRGRAAEPLVHKMLPEATEEVNDANGI